MNNMFTHLSENYEACVAVILFAIGMCMLLFDRNLLKKVIGLDIMDSGTFLLLADRYHADRHTGSARADKASLVFSLPHTQGSLSKVLTILSFYDINLTKIQSMPIIGCEWEYRFYVDVSFADYTRYRQSIDAITPLTKDFKILGEYAAFNE